MNKILREFNKDRITVLTTATHERYQSYFSNLPYNFILWNHPQSKPWHSKFAPIPDNHIYINHLTPDIKFDAVLGQNKNIDYDVLRNISSTHKVPHIQLTHTVCDRHASHKYVQYMFDRRGDRNVFITEYSAKMWGFRKYDVVGHMVDTEFFDKQWSETKSKNILSVVNDYKERNTECGFSIWQKNIKELPYTLVGTSNCGLSNPAKDVNQLRDIYQNHLIFLNTSLVSPLPMSLLEAMSCGLCVVSTNTCGIPEVIENGVNGFLCNPDDDIHSVLKTVSEYPVNKLIEIGNNARNTILKKFGKDKFVEDWSKIIETTI